MLHQWEVKHKNLDLSTDLIKGKLATMKKLKKKTDVFSVSPLPEQNGICSDKGLMLETSVNYGVVFDKFLLVGYELIITSLAPCALIIQHALVEYSSTCNC